MATANALAPSAVHYEWCAEELDRHGDAIELHFYGARAEAEAHRPVAEDCAEVKVCLVRDVIRDGDLADRQWAYIKDGRLPAAFDGGAAVPVRFLRQSPGAGEGR